MEFLPAPGQGVIALECRADDAETRALLIAADHAPTRAAATAERAFLAALGAGCRYPVGAFAQLDGELIALRAMIGGAGVGGGDAHDPDRPPVFGDASARVADAEQIGRELGLRLLAAFESGAAQP
jgi:hydroxymethylbilane synthase